MKPSFLQFVSDNTPSWNFVSRLYDSPLLRSVALIPLLGYLILFSDGLQDFVGDDILLNTKDKLKSIYYGSVLVLFSYLIFLFQCPPIIKISKNVDKAIDWMRTTGSPRQVVNIIFQATTNNRVFGDSQKTQSFCESADHFMSRVFALSDEENKYDDEMAAVQAGIRNNPVLSNEKRKEISEFERALTVRAIQYFQDPFVFESATDIVIDFYVENSRRPLFSRIISVASFLIGAYLLVLPAYKTFLSILLRDIAPGIFSE